MKKTMVVILLLLLVTVVFVAGCSSNSNNNQPSQPSYGGGCGVNKDSSIITKTINKIVTNDNGC